MSLQLARGLAVAIGSIWLIGCGCKESDWGYACGTFDSIPVSAKLNTASGIEYDPSGQPINPALIDRLTHEVEVCLNTSIDRSSFGVKVVSDYKLSCNEPGWGVSQQLNVLAPEDACEDKNQTPDPACPCRYRSGIEQGNGNDNGKDTLITTPSFYLYKDVLIRHTLNVIDPWTAELAPCATPTTGQLSDGTED